MVQLHIKKEDESQFLYKTSVNSSVDECYESVFMIYNGRLKISRICNGKYCNYSIYKIFDCRSHLLLKMNNPIDKKTGTEKGTRLVAMALYFLLFFSNKLIEYFQV